MFGDEVAKSNKEDYNSCDASMKESADALVARLLCFGLLKSGG